MSNLWSLLKCDDALCQDWLSQVLVANKHCAYLKQYGLPSNLKEFRDRLPLVKYEDLKPWIKKIEAGDANVLFDGYPVAYERTGGSSGGSKLIPYTTAGLLDFQHNITPWLANLVDRFSISKRAYFAISPVLREPEQINDVPIGLPDGAYLGEGAVNVLAQVSIVPPSVANITSIDEWRKITLESFHKFGHELELISVWSPTFLIDLFKDINICGWFPNLKVISCWTTASSSTYVKELSALFPQAYIQPKGLIATECVVTIPDKNENLVLAKHGFFEFKKAKDIFLESELSEGSVYEIIATTASGLYRYCTGDLVKFEGRNNEGRPILCFMGRDSLVSDLVGEKLTESFVTDCLSNVSGFRLLVPDHSQRGYCLIVDKEDSALDIALIEEKLRDNPQYAYARKIGQLTPLKLIINQDAQAKYIQCLLNQGVRLGDIKPVSLRKEADWIKNIGELN